MQQLAAFRLIGELTKFLNQQHHRHNIKSYCRSALVLVTILTGLIQDGQIGVLASSAEASSGNSSLGLIKISKPPFEVSRDAQPAAYNERDIVQVLESSKANGVDSRFRRNVANEKHVYNLTSPTNETTTGAIDDLNASDSRSSSRFDSDRDQTLDIDDELSSLYSPSSSNLEQDDSPTDEHASSNLVEQRAITELKKMLSKSGVSGATDKMKLEALERLRLRQRNRKHAKETRSKMLEDLLTTAIESHQDQSTKPASKRTRKHKGSDEPNKQSITSSLLQTNPDLDPEIVGDAEIVLQHLQGLASGVMGKAGQPDSANPIWMLDSSSGVGGGNGGINSKDYSNDNNSDEATPSYQDVEQEGKTPKETNQFKLRPISGSELPFSRQFKKLKQQISQRRKQLDHIKKMFNVELALNSKDGSLIGKQVAGSSSTGGSIRKRRKHKQVDEQDEPNPFNQDDFTVIDDSTLHSGLSAKNRKTSSMPDIGSSGSKQSKMRELKQYLMDNPEILASVMSELTVDAEPSSKRLNFIDGSVSEGISMLEGRRGGSLGRHQTRPPADDSDSQSTGWDDRPFKSLRNKFHRSSNLFGSSTTRLRGPEGVVGGGSSVSVPGLAPISLTPIKSKSAESVLIESLRDRQLMNLARLESFIAERQQQSSRRSNIYASLNSNYTPTNGDSSSSFRPSPVMLSQERPMPRLTANNNQTAPGYSNGSQVLHHFVMVQADSPPAAQFQKPVDVTNQAQGYENSIAFQHVQANEYQQQPFGRPVQYQELVPNDGPMRLTNGGQFLELPLNTPRFQQAPTLSRFRDWRDVSQSEASSSQRTNDKASNFPATGMQTWSVPYDLTTGSSSNRVSEPLKQPIQKIVRSPPQIEDLADQVGRQQVSMVAQPRQGQAFVNNSRPHQQQVNLANTVVRDQQDMAITRAAPSIIAGKTNVKVQPAESSFKDAGVQLSGPSDYRPMRSADSIDKSNANEQSAADETIRPEPEFSRSKAPVDYFSAYKEGHQTSPEKINYKERADVEFGEQDSVQRKDRPKSPSKGHKTRLDGSRQMSREVDDGVVGPEFGQDDSLQDINDMGPMWAAAA